MTDCLRFSNRMTFPDISFLIFVELEGPARGCDTISSCLIGWDDVVLGLDLANENFDVLGLRLDNLFSNSRICYLSACSSFPHLLIFLWTDIQYRKSVHHTPGGKIHFLEIEILGQVIVYLLSEYHFQELDLSLLIRLLYHKERIGMYLI